MNNDHMKSDLLTQQELILYDRIRRDINSGFTLEEAVDNLVVLYQPLPDSQKISIEKVRNVVMREQNETMKFLVNDESGITKRKLKEPWWLRSDQNKLWQSTKEILLTKTRMQESDIEELDRVTDVILNEGLSQPRKKLFIPKKGLVLGYVQSGKTTNIISVIAKAVDAGYRFIVVLTGINDNLRRQTQERLDEQLLYESHRWHKLTNIDSDFDKGQDNASAILSMPFKDKPVAIAVMKKNTILLDYLLNWLNDGLTQDVRDQIPMLVIDDECDLATPNTRKNGQTRTNELIEKITNPKFMPKSIYLGYTATPFANMFMDSRTEKSLYPHDLIYPIKPGKGYFGAEQLFGRDKLDSEENDDFEPEVGVLRDIPAVEAANMLSKSWKYIEPWEKENDENKYYEELFIAILWFVLATACREIREGKREYSSMLIHTAVLQNSHFWLRDELIPLLNSLQNEENYNNNYKPILEEIWNFEANSEKNFWMYEKPSWSQISELCFPIISAIEIKVDNFRSDDRISYPTANVSYPRKPQIVLGGNTLSRGLTLEGLVVSYFLRSAKQFDSLLQMGRWFGYRQGYEDLIRIWMPNHPDDLHSYYRSLALVEAEIRETIETARLDGLTPGELPVRIRNIPGLRITRAGAMRNVIDDKVSYQGRRTETHAFHVDQEILKQNLELGINFAKELSSDYENSLGLQGYPVFMGVPSRKVLEFISNYKQAESKLNVSISAIPKYIERANDEFGEILNWNVFIMSPKKSYHEDFSRIVINDSLHINTTNRSQNLTEENIYYIKTLTSKRDILSDVSENQLSTADKDNLKNIKEDSKYFNLRRKIFGGQSLQTPGLLGLYFIDKKSRPKDWNAASEIQNKFGQESGKRPLDAPEHLLGIGVFLPKTENKGLLVDYSVLNPQFLRWKEDSLEDEDSLFDENENNEI